ncbi:MAG TPA: hypothetical protein VGK33_01015 [Chloroflexota bacterium]
MARLVRKVRARFALALGVVLAVSWGVASPAVALEPGVYVDPGSPAGKEYSVPLSVLRQSASGHGGVGSGTQPLFGIGISPPRVGPQASRAPKHGDGSGQTTHAQPTAGSGAAPAARPPGTASAGRTGPAGAAAPGSAALADLTHQRSAAPAVALLAALVVFGGLALGTVILATRRRLS